MMTTAYKTLSRLVSILGISWEFRDDNPFNGTTCDVSATIEALSNREDTTLDIYDRFGFYVGWIWCEGTNVSEICQQKKKEWTRLASY